MHFSALGQELSQGMADLTYSHISNKTFVGLARTVYIYTVNDRIFGDFPANNIIYIHHIHNRHRIYTIYIYGPGQP